MNRTALNQQGKIVHFCYHLVELWLKAYNSSVEIYIHRCLYTSHPTMALTRCINSLSCHFLLVALTFLSNLFLIDLLQMSRSRAFRSLVAVMEQVLLRWEREFNTILFYFLNIFLLNAATWLRKHISRNNSLWLHYL